MSHRTTNSRRTECGALNREQRDDWMARRVRYFGAPCLTRQEYRAVVYSLYGLPEVRPDEKTGTVLVELELPTQGFVAKKMGLSEGRVSQLLSSARRALLWFEDHEVTGVGWYQMPYGRGVEKWDFRAPVLDHPIPPDPAQRSTRVEVVREDRHYRLAFAGEV